MLVSVLLVVVPTMGVCLICVASVAFPMTMGLCLICIASVAVTNDCGSMFDLCSLRGCHQ